MTAGPSILEKCWAEADRLVALLMAPDIDKTTTEYQVNTGRLLGLAGTLMLFMDPHFTTEKAVLTEGIRRKKAREAGEFYETAGLGSRRTEAPPTSLR
jgi:hypothetical protein